MKQKLGIAAILALSLTLALAVFTGRRAVRGTSERSATETSSTSTATGPGAGPSSLRGGRATLLSLRPLLAKPIRNESSEMARESPACRELEGNLLGLSLDDVGYPPKISRLPDPAGCSPSDPKAAKILRYYATQCSEPVAEMKEAKFTDCAMALIMARSTFAALAHEPKPLEEMTDLRDLADLLVAEFGEFYTAMSPAAILRLQAVADRMAAVDSNLVPAVKAGAMAAMLDGVMKKDAREKGNTDISAPDWAAFEKRVRQIEELSPNDPDLDTFQRIAHTSGMTTELVKRDSEARLERKPDDWHEHEVLAWANWRLGETADARAALREALRLNPRDEELRRNWTAIQRPNATKDSFKISMKVGIGLKDLVQ
jgi:hypothetical protein